MEEINYTIEKGIPIPKTESFTNVFSDMQVGDSILVNSKRELSKLRGRLKLYTKKKNYKWKFATKSIENGIRLWRIE